MGKKIDFDYSPRVSLSPCSISPISFVHDSVTPRDSPCLGFVPVHHLSLTPISRVCQVPRELWREVFAFLPTATDVFRCRLVNRKWACLATEAGLKRKDFLASLAIGQRSRRKYLNDEIARRALGELVRVKELSMGSTPPYLANRSLRGCFSISPRVQLAEAAEVVNKAFEGLPTIEEINELLLAMNVNDQISLRVNSMHNMLPVTKRRSSRGSIAHPWQEMLLECCAGNTSLGFPFQRSGRRYYVESNPTGAESPNAGSPSSQELSLAIMKKTNCERAFHLLWHALDQCSAGDEIILGPGQHGGSLKHELPGTMAPYPHTPQHAPVTICGKNVVLMSAQCALQEVGEHMDIRESILVPNESWKVESLVDVSFSCVLFKGLVFCGGDLTLYEGLLRVHTHGCVTLQGCILDFAGSGGGVVVEDGALIVDDCVMANSAGEAVSLSNVGGVEEKEKCSSVCVMRRSKFMSNGCGDFCCAAGSPAIRVSSKYKAEEYGGVPLVRVESCEFLNNTGPEVEVTAQTSNCEEMVIVSNCKKDDGADAQLVVSVIDQALYLGPSSELIDHFLLGD